MKYIFLNLKRFDIQRNFGGVNSLVSPAEWGSHIAGELEEGLGSLVAKEGQELGEYQFPVFFPECIKNTFSYIYVAMNSCMFHRSSLSIFINFLDPAKHLHISFCIVFACLACS